VNNFDESILKKINTGGSAIRGGELPNRADSSA
jgi:hypothetical protein